jgi:MarR family 2-MHQ and catechol resistance regulon transcriptional repressor
MRLGLTDSQFGVLEALLPLGPVAQHELSRALFTGRANITTVVDNLERRGLVQRVRDTADRRHVTVHLTAEGRALIEDRFPGHVAAIVEEFSVLSAAEQGELGRVCKKLGRRDEPGPERHPGRDPAEPTADKLAGEGHA